MVNAAERQRLAGLADDAIREQEDARAVLAAADAQAHAALRDGDHDGHAATAPMVLVAQRAYVDAVTARLDARAAEVAAWVAVALDVAARTPDHDREARRHAVALLLEVADDHVQVHRERTAWLRAT